MVTNYSFDSTKNKLDCYRGKDCIKRFCNDLKEHATKIVNDETKKEIIPLTDEEIYKEQKACYIYKEEITIDDNNKKNYKVKGHYQYKET